MTRKTLLVFLLLTTVRALPSVAQLQYFGYVGSANDDVGLNKTKDFTNFAFFSAAADLASTTVRDRVQALSQTGGKAVIDLGLVLWCGSDPTTYRLLCVDYVQRWTTWKQTNSAILSSDKVLAFSILDEPFKRDADMAQFDAAVHMVKADFPWAKIYLTEAACAVRGQCGASVTAFSRYTGTLPDVDWVGLLEWAIYPSTDTGYQSAVAQFKSRFPGKKWLYVIDGFWESSHAAKLRTITVMGQIARQWYDVARADSDAVLLGVFGWGPLPPWTLAKDFPCSVMLEHVAIGRAITGKFRHQTAQPIGLLEWIESPGIAHGFACDPDATLCEVPPVDFYVDGIYTATASYPAAPNDYSYNTQCGSGIAYRFHQTLYGLSGHTLTVKARDLDGGTVTLPNTCPDSPSCLWYSNQASAQGYLDAINAFGVATGWVCDPDAPSVSSQVRFAVNLGNSIGVFTANLSNEQEVTALCGGGAFHRFSVQLPAWTQGSPIVAFAQDFTSGEVQIPTLCGDGLSCIW